jgi:dihydroorotate dehydrogenase
MIKPLYDIEKDYACNLDSGPIFDHPIPEREWADEKDWIDFLGIRVASPLGVPAGPLLNSRWTTLAAELGFDIVTYKTIRSHAYPGYPLPNVIPVVEKEKGIVQKSEANTLSITNSFGMPSMSPDYLQTDIAKAKAALKKGQLLIVSVVGSSNDILDDFIRTALMAKDAGAEVLEANFSCPNVSSQEGCLYANAENSFKVASALVKAIHPLPLIIKVGKYPNKEMLQKVLIALSRAGARAVCGINGISMRVVDDKGAPVLGKGRELSGICGNMIRPAAIEFIKDASEIIRKQQLDLELIGCGGITHSDHFDEFLQAGAKIATTATGMMWDPYLAMNWHKGKK